jgi:hypothetical protein
VDSHHNANGRCCNAAGRGMLAGLHCGGKETGAGFKGKGSALTAVTSHFALLS